MWPESGVYSPTLYAERAAARVAPINGRGDEELERLARSHRVAHTLRRWSSTWLVIKIGLRDLPPVSFVALRFVVAILVLLAISIGRARLLPRSHADYLVLTVTGLFMFGLNYTLLFWAELHVSSGLAAVIQASIPIFGMIFAHWMLPDEPLRWQRLFGALVAIAGVGLICARLLSFNGWLAFLGGVAITIGAASAAFSNVLLKARKIQLAPSMLAAWQMISGTCPGPARPNDRWKPIAVSLDRTRDSLPPLSGRDRVVLYLSAPLLAPAPHVGDQVADDRVHHAAGRNRARLGLWWRTAFGLVASRRGLCSSACG